MPPISPVAVTRQMQVSPCMRYGPATIRQVRRYGTQVVTGERFVIIVVQHSRPAHCTVRTLMAIGCITVAVIIADIKPVSMVTIPPRNMQAITPPLSMSNIPQVSIRSILIVPTAIRPSERRVMNLIPSPLQR